MGNNDKEHKRRRLAEEMAHDMKSNKVKGFRKAVNVTERQRGKKVIKDQLKDKE